MFGLVVLAFATVYFTVMFFAVRGAWRMGLADGGTWRRAIGFASLAFLAVYLPVFWDLIPTHAVHRHMCAQDAGFTALVDAKEWRAKNAEAVAAVSRLGRTEREAAIREPNTPDGFERVTVFGGLFARDFKLTPVFSWLSVQRYEVQLVDARNGERLASATDYVSGYGSSEDLRFWLRTYSCTSRSSTATALPVRPTELLHRFQQMLKGEQ